MRISDWSSDVCSSDLTRRLRPVRRRRDGRRHPHRTRLKKRSNIMENATYEIRAGGIALVTIDMKGTPVNAMNDAFSAMLDAVLGRLDADKDSDRNRVEYGQDVAFGVGRGGGRLIYK